MFRLSAMLCRQPGPDVIAGPLATDAGIQSFYNFGKEFDEHHAQLLKQEFQILRPAFGLIDAGKIITIRRTLVANNWQSRLPYKNLAFFLQYCHSELPDGFHDDTNHNDAKTVVDRALRAVDVHNQYNAAAAEGPDQVDALDKNEYHLVFESTLLNLETNFDFILDSNEQTAAHYGGILTLDSSTELLKKISHSTDATQQRMLWSHVCALHAIRDCTVAKEAAKRLGGLVELIKELTTPKGN